MSPAPAARGASAPADDDQGSLLGKRYVDPDSGLELLCTKAGEGTLRVDGAALGVKQAKNLPSSD
ncbi:MAG: hypothetical protein ABWX57_12285 [Aeromicrobium sp.]